MRDLLGRMTFLGRTGWSIATGKRVPVLVSWNITYRCNFHCVYCNTHEREVRESDTATVLRTAARLARLGARFVGFSGGEPLIRADFITIVRACRELGLEVSIQTNGSLMRRRLPVLSLLNEVRVSLDGVREVQEAMRGPGSFDAAMNAVALCRDHGVPVLATAVLSSKAVAHLTSFLSLAEDIGIEVLFQPMDARFAGSLPADHPSWPDPSEFRMAVDDLIARKEQGSRAVANSLPGLRYMRGWPDPDPMPCRASRLMCAVDADGRVFPCDMFPGWERHGVQADGDIETALRGLDLPDPCPRCVTGGMVDLNLAAQGRPQAARSVLERLWRVRKGGR